MTQGFRDPDALSGIIDRTAPTLTRLGRHILLSIAASTHWDLAMGDITTAFLQGQKLSKDRALLIRLPSDARKILGVTDPKGIMRLHKPAYGLCDAPRAWYVEATRRLESLGFRRHALDSCLFLLHNSGGKLTCMLALYVDDVLMAGSRSSSEYQKVKKELQDSFSSREFHDNEQSFEFLGSRLDRLPDGVLKHHQQPYISKLHPIAVEKSRLADTASPVTEKERTKLRALVGGLQWAATQSAPHLQVHTSMLAGEASKATVATRQEANKALRFAKENADAGLLYGHLGPIEDLTVVGRSDASFASRGDLSSQGGYLITLCHKDMLQHGAAGSYHVLDWRSFKLPGVARSTLSAEGQAAAEAADTVYFTSLFLKLIFEPGLDLASPTAAQREQPSALVVDAKALYDLLTRDELQAQLGAEKRTAIETLVTKQRLQEAVADGLTKTAAAQLFADRLRTHRNRLPEDTTYQAARKKDPQRRHASATEFAVSRSQASSTVFFATAAASVGVAQAKSEKASHFDWVDVMLILFTLLIGLIIIKWLAAPLSWAAPAPRIILREEGTQVGTASQEQATQATTVPSSQAVQTSLATLRDAATQTEPQVVDHRTASSREAFQVSVETQTNLHMAPPHMRPAPAVHAQPQQHCSPSIHTPMQEFRWHIACRRTSMHTSPRACRIRIAAVDANDWPRVAGPLQRTKNLRHPLGSLSKLS